MKKLLVLSLVMGIASLASAGYSLGYDGANVTVSGVDGVFGIDNGVGMIGGTLPTIGVVDPTRDAEVVADPIWTSYTAGDMAYYGLPYTGGALILTWGDAVTEAYSDGAWFSFALAGYQLGTQADHVLQLDLINSNVEVAGNTLYLSEIPEPATMALLGLGALVLRRRKK